MVDCHTATCRLLACSKFASLTFVASYKFIVGWQKAHPTVTSSVIRHIVTDLSFALSHLLLILDIDAQVAIHKKLHKHHINAIRKLIFDSEDK